MTVQVCVDLSNVCRDENLGVSHDRASWRRWLALRSILKDKLGTEADFFLVADSNLRRMFSRSDQVRFDQESQSGKLVASVEADRVLLERAIASASYVVSNDTFTDYMKMPGITSLRVLRWGVRGGSVLVNEVALEMPHSVLITERVEKEERKRNWAETADLDHRWHCTNLACAESLILVPNFRRSAAVCPSCGSFLSEGEPWRAAAQVKLLWDGKEFERRTVEDGQVLTIGRLPRDDRMVDVSPYVGKRSVGKISRRHLGLRNEAGRILAKDLGSSNGSELLVPAESRLRHRSWRPGVRLKPEEEVCLARGVRLRLGGIPLVVELSGRGFGRVRS